MEQLGAGSRTEGVEAFTELTLDLLQVHGVAIAALDGHGLAGVQPDPRRERERGIGDRLLDEPLLQGHGATDRRARRIEDNQGLVPAELEYVPPAIFDHGAGDLGEAPGEAPGLLVAAFLRERRVAANVGDQERVDAGVSAGIALGLRSTARLARWWRPAFVRITHPGQYRPFLSSTPGAGWEPREPSSSNLRGALGIYLRSGRRGGRIRTAGLLLPNQSRL